MDAIGKYGLVNGAKLTTAAAATAQGQRSAAQQQTAAAIDKAVKQDTLTLSVEERKRAMEEALQKKLQEKEAAAKAMLREVENAKKQNEAMQDTVQKQNKCFVIAMRIMAGDKVPPGDYRYLAKNSPGLYSQALTLRVARETPRKYKQVSGHEPERSAQPHQTKTDDSADSVVGSGDGGAAGQEPSAPAPDANGGGAGANGEP